MGTVSSSSPGPHVPARARLSPDSLIRGGLGPLQAAAGSMLARGDRAGALRLVFRVLSGLSDRLAARNWRPLPHGHVRVHAWLLEGPGLSYEACFDGTLIETPAALRVTYRHWTVERNKAALLAEMLAERWPAALPAAVFGASPSAWPPAMIWI